MTAARTPVRRTGAAGLAHVAVFAALLATLSLVPAIPIGGAGVPITLQTLGVVLCGLCLGPLRGFAAVMLYVVAGLAGLPIFAGGKAGLAVLAGPTAGYLVSFPLVALVTGFVAVWVVRRGMTALSVVWLFLGVVLSRFLITLPLGVLGMARALDLTFGQAFVIDIAYWPGDLIKGAIAAILAVAVHKAFPRLLGR